MAHPVPSFENEYKDFDASSTAEDRLVFPFSFPYSKSIDVKVDVNNSELDQDKYIVKANNTVVLVQDPPDKATVRIYRESSVETMPAFFTTGSAIKSKDLNDNFNQTLWITQELTKETNDFDDIIKKYVVDNAILQGDGGSEQGDVKGLKYAVDTADNNAGDILALQEVVGNSPSDALRGDVSKLITDVGDENSGLEKRVNTLEDHVVGVNETSGLKKAVDDLEGIVGADVSSPGLQKKVKGLEDIVGADENSEGLQKRVRALEDADHDTTDLEEAIDDLEEIVGADENTDGLQKKVKALEDVVTKATTGLVALVGADANSGLRGDVGALETDVSTLETNAARRNTENKYPKPQIGEYGETITHSTDDDDISFDLDKQNHFIVDIEAGWDEFKFTNLDPSRAGMTGSIILKYDGSHTGRKADHMLFPGGSTPSWTSASGKIDRIDYIVLNDSQVLCNFTANYS